MTNLESNTRLFTLVLLWAASNILGFIAAQELFHTWWASILWISSIWLLMPPMGRK